MALNDYSIHIQLYVYTKVVQRLPQKYHGTAKVLTGIQYGIKKHSTALTIKSLTILILITFQCCVCVESIDIWYRSSFKEVLEDLLEKPQGETPLPLLQASFWLKPSDVMWYMTPFTWVLMRWWWAWLLLRYLASITRSPDIQAAVLPIRNNVWFLSALCIEERFIWNWEPPKYKHRGIQRGITTMWEQNNNYKLHKTKINSDGT